MIWIYVLTFIVSCFLLAWMGSMLVEALVSMAKCLKWREFVVAFFIVAIASCLPNFFVDINAALHGIPLLAFGDTIGGNMADLSLVVALAVLLTRGNLPAESRMVQTSAIFTTGAAILPLLLIFDGNLDRKDGIILMSVFIFYLFWIFSKKERFKKTYGRERKRKKKKFVFLKNLAKIVFYLGLLLLSSEGIIKSVQFFSDFFGISISIIGILIVGLGNCFPEIYFMIITAKREQNWLILGDIMGSVIACSTLVLGTVALVSPFEIPNLYPFAIARLFTIAIAIFFLITVRTDQKITKKEGLFLLGLYIAFIFFEVFFK